MRTTVLLLITTFLPLVWGWSMHWLMAKLWAPNAIVSRAPLSEIRPPVPPVDYQI